MLKRLKLQCLVVIHTAPGQSYVNPLEQTVSVLFIGLQNVALECNESSTDDEILKKCKNVGKFLAKPNIKKDS